MPKIIPIKEFKNTAYISKVVHESDEPVFVTKNGYGDMVIMSIDVYENELKKIYYAELINEAIKDHKNTDANMFLQEMKSKYGKKD